MGWLYFWILNFIWAGSYFVVDSVTSQLDAILLTWLRLFLTALFVVIIYPKAWGVRTLGIYGILLLGASSIVSHIIPFTLLNIGQRLLNPAMTTLIISSTPLFVVILRVLIKPRSAVARELIPIIIGFYGIFVLSNPEQTNYSLSMLLVLGAAASYASAMHVNTYISHRENILMASFVQTSFSSFIILLYLLITNENYIQQLQTINTTQWIWVVTVLGGGGAIGAFVYFNMLKHLGPEQSSYITYTIPITSGLFFFTISSFVPSREYIVGSCVILCALFLTKWFNHKNKYGGKVC